MRRAFHLGLCAWACLLAYSRTATGALPQTQPWPVRVASNGHGVVVVDASKGGAVDWWVRPYAMRGPGEPTADVLHDAYFGVHFKKGQWAKDLPLAKGSTAVQYGAGTALVQEHRHVDGGFDLVTWVCTLSGIGRPAFLLGATVTSFHPDPVSLALLANFHVGPGAPQPASAPERIQRLSKTDVFEWSPASPHRVLVRALAGSGLEKPDAWSDLPSEVEVVNPLAKWEEGTAFGPEVDSGVGSDRVMGIAWPTHALFPNYESVSAAVLVVHGTGDDAKTLQAAADQWQASAGPIAALKAAIAAATAPPPGLQVPSGAQEFAERFQFAARLLAGAQSHEPNFGPPHSNQTPFGQIPASLPPGQWHITWPRDQAYAGVALTVAGLHQQARAALDFVLNGKTGGFVDKIGAPYLVSPTRYYGGGLEEVDVNENGPNVELDGFGLVLWQAGRYVDASNDTAWLNKAWPQLRDGAAQVLVQAVDGTGLIKPDSSIWEVHWNGQQKHFTYTSAMAVRGLCAAAKLATRMGQGALAAEYRDQAKGIRDAISKHLVKDGVLRGNLEEAPDQAFDAAVVEAFLDGQLDPAGQVAVATWQALKQKLAADGGPGFIRNDDGGAYDSAEWLFVDLRMLCWLEKMAAAGVPGAADDAKLLRERVLAIAAAGGGLLPELIATSGPKAGQFDGAVPMVGFGAGVLVLALAGAAGDDDVTACLGGSRLVDVVELAEEVAAAEVVEELATTADALSEAAVEAVTADALEDGKVATQPAQQQPAQDDGCAAGAGHGGTSVFVLVALALAFLVMRRRMASRLFAPAGRFDPVRSHAAGTLSSSCLLASPDYSRDFVAKARFPKRIADAPGAAQ
jgi:uncharacterized protein (TIGR03382 family)